MEAKKQALEKSLISLQSNMLSFAFRLTSDKEDAKDLTQEATLKVLSSFDKYYDNINFKGWVFTIMHNIFVNNYRQTVRNQTIVDQTENLYWINLAQNSASDSPEDAYSYIEIYKVLNTFNEEHRVPFTMHLSGYKYEEIAKKMNLPLGTIKSRIFFARKRLQELLKDYD